MAYRQPKTEEIFVFKDIDFLTLQTTKLFTTGAKSFVATNLFVVLTEVTGSITGVTTSKAGVTGPDYDDLFPSISIPFDLTTYSYSVQTPDGSAVIPIPPETDFYYKISVLGSGYTVLSGNIYVQGFYI